MIKLVVQSSLLLILLMWGGSVTWAASAMVWLQSQNVSASPPSSIATPYQAAEELIRTYQLLNLSVDNYEQAAVDLIISEPYSTTDALSRKIIAYTYSFANADIYVQKLLNYQNSDGGFGELNGYDSNVLDTANALIALHISNAGTSQQIGMAINALIREQKSDGGFSVSNVNESSLYITAKTSVALQQYLLPYSTSAYVSNSQQYLVQKALKPGFWSSNWEVAAALLSIIPMTTDTMIYQDAVNQLQTSQLTTGSWDNEVWVTSLAMQAQYLASAGSVSQPPTQSRLIGKVVNQATGRPLVGAYVFINTVPMAETYSGADGSFELVNNSTGMYLVTYQTAGYIGVTSQASVLPGQVTDLGVVALSSNPTTSIIEGSILDKQSGLPVIGATIVAQGSVATQVTVDANGLFRLVVPPEHVTLTVHAPGYQTLKGTATTVIGRVLNFSPSLQANKPAMPLTATIQGVVSDAYSNTLLPGVTIQVDGNPAAITDINGTFSISSLNIGSVSIQLRSSGYQTASYTVVLSVGENLNLGSIKLDAQAIVNPYVQIQGMVVDAYSALPLFGATMQVANSPFATTTTVDGKIQVFNVTTGNLVISVSKPGYVTIEYPAIFQSDGIVNLGVIQLHEIQLQAQANLMLSGVIVDSYGSAAIAGAKVAISGTTISSTTANDGSFQISENRSGNLSIEISKSGYQTVTFTVNINANIPTTIDLGQVSISPIPAGTNTATLSGVVVASDSNLPLQGASIQLLNNPLSSLSLLDGSFLLSDIPVGQYDVSIGATAYQAINYTINVSGGSSISLGNVTLLPTSPMIKSTISGIVTDQYSGVPISGAKVWIVETGQNAITNRDGKFTISNVSVLNFNISAQVDGFSGTTQSLNMINHHPVQMDFTLLKTRIVGFTIDALTTDAYSYEAFSKVQLSAIFSNNSVLSITLQMVLKVVDNQGVTIDVFPAIHSQLPSQITDSILSVKGGGILPVGFEWDTRSYPPGGYQLILMAYDSSNLRLLGTRAASIEILQTQHIVNMTFIPQPLFSFVGASEAIDFTLTTGNRSNVPVEQSFTYSLTDPYGSLVWQGSATTVLQPDEMNKIENLHTLNHIFQRSGEYKLSAQLVSGVVPDVLVGTSIFVSPNIRININQQVTPSITTPDGDKKIQFHININGVDGGFQ